MAKLLIDVSRRVYCIFWLWNLVRIEPEDGEGSDPYLFYCGRLQERAFRFSCGVAVPSVAICLSDKLLLLEGPSRLMIDFLSWIHVAG